MKVLFTADWHLDWTTGGVERFDEVSAALNQIHATAIAERVDLLIFGGDLCDPDVDSPLCHRAIARAVDFGRKLHQDGVESLWITGNHDVIEDGRGSHTLMALRAAGLHVADEPVGLGVSGVGVVLLPYVSPSRRYDPAGFIERMAVEMRVRAGDPPFIVAGHMTRVRGASDGSETHDMPRGSDMEFPVDACHMCLPGAVLLNGHFHRRVVDGPVLIPGSLARLTHGEETNEPGFIIVET